jgi:hypothetical protein
VSDKKKAPPRMSWIDKTVPAFFLRFFLVEHIYVKEDS